MGLESGAPSVFTDIAMGAEPSPVDAAAACLRLPRHVGIIMDGNGRWAKHHGLPRGEGHRRGVEALRRAVRFSARRGIHFLTLFSFSSENWSRPRDEVQGLFNLLRIFIRSDLAELHGSGVRIRVIGEREALPADIRSLIEEAELTTAGNSGLQLLVAFNYGGREEIVRAARRLAERVARGEIAPEAISEALIAGALDTAGIPDPDVILRTSGEKRISNFLLWQGAYSELIFLPVLWPDFGDREFETALDEYAARDRRYGGVGGA
jgi:undecaprenyl diphosphate synthase